MKRLEFRIMPEDSGVRVDVKASELSGLSRSRTQQLIDSGLLTVNRSRIKQNYRVKRDDLIEIDIPEGEHGDRLLPEDIPLEILFMDDHLAVVDKPAGMVVYPGAGHGSGTLLNALAFRTSRLASVGGPLRPGVVHRLDKDTSGIMVVALEDAAYYDLVEQFRKRTIQRKYQALVFGSLKGESGEITLRIGRSESERKKMTTRTKRGKEAVTKWKVLERFPGATLLEARLGTGRTHQIRVHFASTGHPVLGDRTYGKKIAIEAGKKKITFPRQMLHAELLGFVHPATGEYMEFSGPPAKDMDEKIQSLRALK